MLSFDILIAALQAEVAAVALCLLALVTLRNRITARRAEVEGALRALEPPLHIWLASTDELEGFLAAVRRLPAHAAFRALARLVTAMVPFERQQVLAQALRGEPWVVEMLRDGDSPFWWKRFDVARLLSIVGVDSDWALIGALLEDRNPAVRLVAFDAAARLPKHPLIGKELDDLPSRQDAVQAYQLAALARHPQAAAEALTRRLDADAPVASLTAWIDAAGAIACAEPLRRVRALATHSSAEVRVHVARALRRLAEPETVPVVLALLTDSDWRVRAQASRAAGALRMNEAAEALAVATCDPSWWVRYRSSLALAQIGGEARHALEATAIGDDVLARDMSQLVVALSPAAVIELSEV